MHESDDTVLPVPQPLNEVDFHAAMMEAISRQISRHGKGRVAQVMGLSIRQLENLGTGSFPRIDRVYNLQSLDMDAMDPIDRLYSRRGVPRAAICSTDPVSTKLAALLTHTIEIERADSEAGPDASLGELLGIDERTLRHAALKLAGWVERIDAYRTGTKPILRAVSK